MFRTCPSANYYEYNCVAIGARSQTAVTYLENRLDTLPEATSDQLINLALAAMKKAQDVEINSQNVDVGIVGADQEFKILSQNELAAYLEGNVRMDIVI